jgi:hypothetical protein
MVIPRAFSQFEIEIEIELPFADQSARKSMTQA